jgi:glycerophosphoryl diester phosphodiesterase
MAVWMSAHRGGAGLKPENTLASFCHGLTYDPDFLEMDVHLTKDGIPVVIHDPRIDRTTDGTGRVVDYTLAELQTFNAAARFAGEPHPRQSIPAFGEVLDAVRNTPVRLEVEIKPTADVLRYPGIEQKVVDAIAARGMIDRVRLLAFEFDSLVRAKAIDPRVQAIALLSFGYLGSVSKYRAGPALDHVVTMEADGIGVSKDLLTAPLVQEAHRRNLLVGVWTCDTEVEIAKFVEMGVDSITTNRPDVLKRVLGR